MSLPECSVRFILEYFVVLVFCYIFHRKSLISVPYSLSMASAKHRVRNMKSVIKHYFYLRFVQSNKTFLQTFPTILSITLHEEWCLSFLFV